MQQHKRILIGLTLIIIFAILIFSIPQLVGKRSVAPILSISALVLISIYIILSLEIIHRGSLALLGATIIGAVAIAFGALQPEESLDFIVEEAIDFNAIGLLLKLNVDKQLTCHRQTNSEPVSLDYYISHANPTLRNS